MLHDGIKREEFTQFVIFLSFFGLCLTLLFETGNHVFPFCQLSFKVGNFLVLILYSILQVDNLPSGAKCFAFDLDTPRDPATSIQIAGFPMGTQVSDSMLLTQGIISNTENECTITNTHGVKRTFDIIRTQAGATHGSSGGPVMLSSNWRVIGILHGGMNEEGFAMNIVSDIRQLFHDNTLNIKT
jgi:hypothetical protein